MAFLVCFQAVRRETEREGGEAAHSAVGAVFDDAFADAARVQHHGAEQVLRADGQRLIVLVAHVERQLEYLP